MRNVKIMLLTVVIIFTIVTALPAVTVFINFDVHMDIPNREANDFHVQGIIKSGPVNTNWAWPPELLLHIDDMFPDFKYSITPLPTSPTQNEFIFTADWSGNFIKYCTIIHLGLKFESMCHNIVAKVRGWWTLDGKRIGEGVNGGTVLIPGFEVIDLQEDTPSRIQIMNDSQELAPIKARVVKMDLVKLKPEEIMERFNSEDEFLKTLRRDGRQEELKWVPVLQNRQLISPNTPVDFRADSFFDVFFNIEIPAGNNQFTLAEPLVMEPGDFLVSRVTLEFQNNAGEIEQLTTWHAHEAHRIDYGDAPPRYPTRLMNNGARHVIRGPWLGDRRDRPDMDWDGQPDPAALGDDNDGNDDEDGVNIPVLIPGQMNTISIQVSCISGMVDAWIDFNKNDVWEPAERIYGGILPPGIHSITFPVPNVIVNDRTFARFRIHRSNVNLPPTGLSYSGEVEDHIVSIGSPPPTPSPNTNCGDVNCDGQVNIIDALIIAQYFVGLIPNLNCCP